MTPAATSPDGSGISCGEGVTVLDRCDPSTPGGFAQWLLVGILVALLAICQGRRPRIPSPRRTYLYPCHSGGTDYRWGVHSGGPLVFGGPIDEDVCCVTVGPILKVRTVIRHGRTTREAWEPRRPKEYRVSPKRFRTSGVLAAIRD